MFVSYVDTSNLIETSKNVFYITEKSWRRHVGMSLKITEATLRALCRGWTSITRR